MVIEALKVDNDKNEQAIVPCKWRKVYYYSSGKVVYGSWEYGDCYDSINTKGERLLIPIKKKEIVK